METRSYLMWSKSSHFHFNSFFDFARSQNCKLTGIAGAVVEMDIFVSYCT